MMDKNSDGKENADDVILQIMIEQAERLCTSGDALLRGQYWHLRGRIQALLDLRCTGDMNSTPAR